jgi:hypothetical protein
LPENDVISIFNIFLLTQLSCSGLISFCAIWSISLYHKHADGNEKGWSIWLLVNIYTKYKMACACTNTRNQVSQLQSENKHKTDEHMIDDTNKSYRKMGDNTETQTISKLSMEFLDSVCYYFFLVVLSLQLTTYCAIIHYRNNL